MFVVDASLAVELALDRMGEQAGADLDRGGELIAPPLLWSEVPSVLHEISFRREISGALAELAIQRFARAKRRMSPRHP
jgi:predicted nucleic acid-binding protein